MSAIIRSCACDGVKQERAAACLPRAGCNAKQTVAETRGIRDRADTRGPSRCSRPAASRLPRSTPTRGALRLTADPTPETISAATDKLRQQRRGPRNTTFRGPCPSPECPPTEGEPTQPIAFAVAPPRQPSGSQNEPPGSPNELCLGTLPAVCRLSAHAGPLPPDHRAANCPRNLAN
ncbi:hypothetical protein AAFF_G00341570 [Aldrovandia affinis]|uniref:Uncharacterized protein n=1 Tax=Aldrovandia affinis TaxID=143900 RepID=A0AAD7WQ86_9TELE|nr:hypothetical protein AAFF_G00341570 [Aldrovandia affinis]